MSGNNTLDKMISEFKTEAELKNYAEVQHKTIIELKREIENSKQQNEQLKKLLNEISEVNKNKTTFIVSDEEMICRMQLNRLKVVSMERELTLEESRKVDIYSKILFAIENKPKTIKVETENLKDEDLLAILTNEHKTE